jgi:hypothetical protein
MRKRLEAHGVKTYNGVTDSTATPPSSSVPAAMKPKSPSIRSTCQPRPRRHPYTTYAHMANIKNQPIPGFYATAMASTRGNSPTRDLTSTSPAAS